MDVMEKDVARVFEENTGMYHVCPENLPYLDARGGAYATKAAALRVAALAGYTHATGSGCPWDGTRRIPRRFRPVSAAERAQAAYCHRQRIG